MMSTKLYKIYNPVTGLYSKGGVHANDLWTKNGRAWTIAGLKGHLNLFKKSGYKDNKQILELYRTCVIHEFEADPVELSIAEFL